MKLATIILFMVATSGLASSQTTEDKIVKIRENFKIIEASIKEKKYDIKTIEFDTPESNSYGTIEYYTENNEIRKVIFQEIINEENSQTTSYYAINGELFFAYHVSKAPRMIDEMQMEIHNKERRFYYFEEKPIRCLEKYYIVNTNSEIPESKLAQKAKNQEVDCVGAASVLEKYKEVLKSKKE